MAKQESIIGLSADPNDPDDFDVSEATIEQALGARRLRRQGRVGRPEGGDKERITIRLDKDLLAKWRATGAGWQTRLNDALRQVNVK